MEIIVNECKWLWMSQGCPEGAPRVNEFERMYVSVKYYETIEWVWISLKECAWVWSFVNECEGLWKIENDCEWVWRIVKDWEWLWMSVKDCARLRMNVNKCEGWWKIENECGWMKMHYNHDIKLLTGISRG